ncbi:hypothetical protein VaNZ11_005135 [Volvox africanus]|uniref:Uncharacterized protein n=1 Tax=Volvox africanus TaxID=51714 RepID=A0ABQ5RYA6_9CHLO|nr:hypothetical protein VaNZ11_005135 [Volvox africanus]
MYKETIVMNEFNLIVSACCPTLHLCPFYNGHTLFLHFSITKRRLNKNSEPRAEMEKWRQGAEECESPSMSTTATDESSGCEDVLEHEATSSRRGPSGARATSGSHGTSGSASLGDPLARTPYRAWTKEEDELLRTLVDAHGANKWTEIAGGLPGRTGKSCRLRWVNQLRGDLLTGAFTPAEDQKIVEMQATYGNKWSAIARELPGRTDNMVKNRWNSYLKRRVEMGRAIALSLGLGLTVAPSPPVESANTDTIFQQQMLVTPSPRRRRSGDGWATATSEGRERQRRSLEQNSGAATSSIGGRSGGGGRRSNSRGRGAGSRSGTSSLSGCGQQLQQQQQPAASSAVQASSGRAPTSLLSSQVASSLSALQSAASAPGSTILSQSPPFRFAAPVLTGNPAPQPLPVWHPGIPGPHVSNHPGAVPVFRGQCPHLQSVGGPSLAGITEAVGATIPTVGSHVLPMPPAGLIPNPMLSAGPGASVSASHRSSPSVIQQAGLGAFGGLPAPGLVQAAPNAPDVGIGNGASIMSTPRVLQLAHGGCANLGTVVPHTGLLGEHPLQPQAQPTAQQQPLEGLPRQPQQQLQQPQALANAASGFTLLQGVPQQPTPTPAPFDRESDSANAQRLALLQQYFMRHLPAEQAAIAAAAALNLFQQTAAVEAQRAAVVTNQHHPQQPPAIPFAMQGSGGLPTVPEVQVAPQASQTTPWMASAPGTRQSAGASAAAFPNLPLMASACTFSLSGSAYGAHPTAATAAVPMPIPGAAAPPVFVAAAASTGLSGISQGGSPPKRRRDGRAQPAVSFADLRLTRAFSTERPQQRHLQPSGRSLAVQEHQPQRSNEPVHDASSRRCGRNLDKYPAPQSCPEPSSRMPRSDGQMARRQEVAAPRHALETAAATAARSMSATSSAPADVGNELMTDSAGLQLTELLMASPIREQQQCAAHEMFILSGSSPEGSPPKGCAGVKPTERAGTARVATASGATCLVPTQGASVTAAGGDAGNPEQQSLESHPTAIAEAMLWEAESGTCPRDNAATTAIAGGSEEGKPVASVAATFPAAHDIQCPTSFIPFEGPRRGSHSGHYHHHHHYHPHHHRAIGQSYGKYDGLTPHGSHDVQYAGQLEFLGHELCGFLADNPMGIPTPVDLSPMTGSMSDLAAAAGDDDDAHGAVDSLPTDWHLDSLLDKQHLPWSTAELATNGSSPRDQPVEGNAVGDGLCKSNGGSGAGLGQQALTGR